MKIHLCGEIFIYIYIYIDQQHWRLIALSSELVGLVCCFEDEMTAVPTNNFFMAFQKCHKGATLSERLIVY